MHSTEVKGVTFVHNGDYSGDVFLMDFREENGDPISVPFEALKGLVANWVRSRRISKLEQAEDDELLLGKQ